MVHGALSDLDENHTSTYDALVSRDIMNDREEQEMLNNDNDNDNDNVVFRVLRRARTLPRSAYRHKHVRIRVTSKATSILANNSVLIYMPHTPSTQNRIRRRLHRLQRRIVRNRLHTIRRRTYQSIQATDNSRYFKRASEILSGDE